VRARAVDASCIAYTCCCKEPGLPFAFWAEGPFLSTRAGNISPRQGEVFPFSLKVNAMEEGDVSAFRPAVPCALLSGHTGGKVRVWGFWSKLRWYFLG
jgi:hypothetical protein